MSLIAQLVLGAAAIVGAHDVLFLVRYGSAYGEALAHAGHDGTWTRAVVVVTPPAKLPPPSVLPGTR